jgi:hypothetical protein
VQSKLLQMGGDFLFTLYACSCSMFTHETFVLENVGHHVVCKI